MRNRTWFAVAVVAMIAGAACGSKKDPDQTGGSATVAGSGAGGSAAGGSGSATGPGSGAGSGAGIDAAAICADSGLILMDVELDKAAAKFCDLCKATKPDACTGKWPDDFVAKGASIGERMDVLRNTIYAGHGYPFKKQKWIDLFGAKAWYRKDDAFAETALSKVARENVARLKETRKNAGTLFELRRSFDGKAVGSHYDIDGDGTQDSIEIASDGKSVTIGKAAFAVPEERDGSPVELYTVSVIDLDTKAKGAQVALTLGLSDEEDVERWLIFDVAGTWTLVGDVPPGDVAGDRTVVSRSYNCGVVTATTWKLGSGKGFAQAGTKTTGTHDPDQCAACPYVYLISEDGARFQGEVLRYQAGAGAYRADALALADRPAIAGGMIRIEVREAKPETTYLDAIQLDVDGELVDPADCNDAGGTPCAADHRFTVIRHGEGRAFAFPWRGAPPRSVTVRATGYYVPDGR